MQSMIKREVSVSITAHVELITQLVADAYTLHKERSDSYTKGSRQKIAICRGNMLYYRMSRQTGHTAALKKLLSQKFQSENDAYVFGLFHSEAERNNVFDNTRNVSGETFTGLESDKKSMTASININWRGTVIDKANILVFSDTLHDAKRLEAAHKFLSENAVAFPNLTLVVFLG